MELVSYFQDVRTVIVLGVLAAVLLLAVAQVWNATR